MQMLFPSLTSPALGPFSGLGTVNWGSWPYQGTWSRRSGPAGWSEGTKRPPPARDDAERWRWLVEVAWCRNAAGHHPGSVHRSLRDHPCKPRRTRRGIWGQEGNRIIRLNDSWIIRWVQTVVGFGCALVTLQTQILKTKYYQLISDDVLLQINQLQEHKVVKSLPALHMNPSTVIWSLWNESFCTGSTFTSVLSVYFDANALIL